MTYVHVPRDATSRQGEGRHAHKKDASFIEDARPRTVGSGQSESLLPGRNKSKSGELKNGILERLMRFCSQLSARSSKSLDPRRLERSEWYIYMEGGGNSLQ